MGGQKIHFFDFLNLNFEPGLVEIGAELAEICGSCQGDQRVLLYGFLQHILVLIYIYIAGSE